MPGADQPLRHWITFMASEELRARVDTIAHEAGLSRSQLARLVLGRVRSVDDLPPEVLSAVAELRPERRP